MSSIEAGAIYQHYKGEKYRVIGIAKHSETLEEFVIYEALYDHPVSKLWVRPVKLFVGEVEWEGKRVKRFILLPFSS